MLDFLRNILHVFKKQQRFNCNSCYKLIEAATFPKKCPHCKGPGYKIIKLPPKVDIPQKHHSRYHPE